MATTNLAKPTSFDRTLASARSTMMFSEVVRLAVDSFRASKTRFLLTMLGMVIGSASIILVATLGSTGKQYAIDQLTSIGPNKIELQYNGGTVSGPDNTSTPDYMTVDDMKAVLEQVPGIVASSPMLEFHDNISVGGGVSKATMLLGVSPQYRIVRNLVVVSGRFFDDQD
jgi:putative ABC transport system permease protein